MLVKPKFFMQSVLLKIMSFIERHRAVLVERINRDTELLEKLKKEDLTKLDEINREHHQELMKQLQSSIEWHTKTVKLIDEGKIE